MDHNQAVEKRTSLAIFWLLYSWFTDRHRQTLAVQPGSLVLFSTAYHNIIQWPLNSLLKYRGYSSEHFLSRRARMKANHHHRFFLMLPSINILSSEQKSLSSLGCENAHSGSDQAFKVKHEINHSYQQRPRFCTFSTVHMASNVMLCCWYDIGYTDNKLLKMGKTEGSSYQLPVRIPLCTSRVRFFDVW